MAESTNIKELNEKIEKESAFISNDKGIEIFDAEGNFIGADFLVFGNQVWDAGTEVNDESLSSVPFSLALIGQGIDENGIVSPHPGLQPPGTGGLLDVPTFSNSDFTVPGYQIARIQIEQVTVPEPNGTKGLLALGGLLFLGYGLGRKTTQDHT